MSSFSAHFPPASARSLAMDFLRALADMDTAIHFLNTHRGIEEDIIHQMLQATVPHDSTDLAPRVKWNRDRSMDGRIPAALSRTVQHNFLQILALAAERFPSAGLCGLLQKYASDTRDAHAHHMLMLSGVTTPQYSDMLRTLVQGEENKLHNRPNLKRKCLPTDFLKRRASPEGAVKVEVKTLVDEQLTAAAAQRPELAEGTTSATLPSTEPNEVPVSGNGPSDEVLPASVEQAMADLETHLGDGETLDFAPLQQAVEQTGRSPIILQSLLRRPFWHKDVLLPPLAQWLMPPDATSSLAYDRTAELLLGLVMVPLAQSLQYSASRTVLAILGTACRHYRRVMVHHFIVPLIQGSTFGPLQAEIIAQLSQGSMGSDFAAHCLQAVASTPITSLAEQTPNECTVQALAALLGAMNPAIENTEAVVAVQTLVQWMDLYCGQFGQHVRFGSLLFTLVTRWTSAITPCKERVHAVCQRHETFMKKKILAALQQL